MLNCFRRRDDLKVKDLCMRLRTWNRYTKSLFSDISHLEEVELTRKQIEIDERLARRVKVFFS